VTPEVVHILGGGLAGSEAAWQAAEAGSRVVLYEMRPARLTPAHQTGWLAELVCSNSLKSESENSAPWLLKQELRRMGSLLLSEAAGTRVPAGHALTVDRERFARAVTERLEHHPHIEIRREEVIRLPGAITVVATGPLTSEALAGEIAHLVGSERLSFYDGISPIVDADSIDCSIAFRASRYDRSLDGSADYLNCPLDKGEYDRFLDALLDAGRHQAHVPDDAPFFEACLPVEELARRGRDTLRFGPMKPVGLVNPATGRRPYAAVQLRQENLRASSFNLVGFQTTLTYPEQARVFRLIPGLETAEFLRYGQVHRNTYINAPAVLSPALEMRDRKGIFFAGQVSGVEGYIEAIATGLVAGRAAAARARGIEMPAIPRATAIGSLCSYASCAEHDQYQPANMTFDLLPPLDEETRLKLRRDKRGRHAEICRRALSALEEHLA
jgi:methylenetetrahydrofolate--tRNA-(uracil-5-)-methyltransferase